MTQEERLIELESLVRSQGKVTIETICERYNISYDSARRDLVKLTELPGILRIRGGAIVNEATRHLSFAQRNKPDPVKQQLAQMGTALVESGDTLFLDAGTTLELLATSLSVEAKVITNSLENLSALRDKSHISKCVLGGMFDDHSHAVLGNITIEQIKHYRANRAFIGVSALSEDGITTDSEMDAALKKAMAEQSQQVICIATANKFNTQLMHQSCTWRDIDCLITDSMPPQNILKRLEDHEVNLLLIEKSSTN